MLRIFYILSVPEFDINIIQQKAKSYSSEEEDWITFSGGRGGPRRAEFYRKQQIENVWGGEIYLRQWQHDAQGVENSIFFT